MRWFAAHTIPRASKRCADGRTSRLARLAALGTVVETCPTSNLRIGAVPDAKDHPVHRFLASDVRLAIGADDPGLFDCTLADEVNWVQRHTGMTA